MNQNFAKLWKTISQVTQQITTRNLVFKGVEKYVINQRSRMVCNSSRFNYMWFKAIRSQCVYEGTCWIIRFKVYQIQIIVTTAIKQSFDSLEILSIAA